MFLISSKLFRVTVPEKRHSKKGKGKEEKRGSGTCLLRELPLGIYFRVLSRTSRAAEAGVQSLAEKFKLDERAAYKLSEAGFMTLSRLRRLSKEILKCRIRPGEGK